jgi:hypothetical protein|tara:strand:+ start:1435 stop:1650 length:216 start_codon:yes stop_codon:yes gene_type:complete
MSPATEAATKIISNIEANVGTTRYGQLIMEAVLNCAQDFVNDEGFVWDVALAKACQVFRCTEFCALYAYEN